MYVRRAFSFLFAWQNRLLVLDLAKINIYNDKCNVVVREWCFLSQRFLFASENRGFRNYSLDALKLVASFFVVFIHVSFGGVFGEVIKALAGFAVPIFFLTSGYFSYNVIQHSDFNKIAKRIKSVLLIFVMAFVLYSILYIALNGINSFLSIFAIRDTYIKFVFFNNFENTFFTPLWFLPALIYCYLVVLLLMRLKLTRIIPIGMILFVVQVILSGIVMKRYQLSDVFARNFLIAGLPYFSAGYSIRLHKDFLCKVGKKPVLYTLIGSLALFFALYFTIGFEKIAVIGVAISLFVLSVQGSLCVKQEGWQLVLQKASLYIYILHWPIWILITHFHLNCFGWLNPIIVLAVTFLLSLPVVFLNQRFKRAKKAQALGV